MRYAVLGNLAAKIEAVCGERGISKSPSKSQRPISCSAGPAKGRLIERAPKWLLKIFLPTAERPIQIQLPFGLSHDNICARSGPSIDAIPVS